MDFELNENGTIDSQPLAGWAGAIIADEFCLMRLQLALPGETQETASKSVQMTMTADQARALAKCLNDLVAHIPPRPLAN